MRGINRFSNFRQAFLFLMAGCIVAAAANLLAEEVTAHLQSGRNFTGEVDARTDEARLWLRSSGGAMIVTRPLDWDVIATVTRGDEQFSADQFRREAPRLESRFLPTFEPISPQTPRPGIEQQESLADRPSSFKVRSIYLDVEVANWDGDVEMDGLQVHLFPIAADGFVVPVHGSLEVRLVGEQLGIVHDRQPFPQLGRWREVVRRTEFGPAGAVYQLPFQQRHPDFNLDLGSQGLVHARLTVPGQGTFETTHAMVRIRPYSSMRDKLQQQEQRRFFTGERTDRTP